MARRALAVVALLAFAYRLDCPAGYAVAVENLSALQVLRVP